MLDFIGHEITAVESAALLHPFDAQNKHAPCQHGLDIFHIFMIVHTWDVKLELVVPIHVSSGHIVGEIAARYPRK